MRLLLDEHYSRKIAEQLRRRAHDVVSVTERDGLVGLDDRGLLARMAGERRAIVTENAVHFMPLVHESAALGSDHYGLVLTSPRRVPRFRGTIGLYVRLLHELLEAEPAEDALLNQVRWLMP